jgi:copper(I)-binding protein
MKRLLFLALLALATLRAASAAPTIAINDAWSRPATGMGVVYATIVNSGTTPDRLTAATAPNAASVELHQSTSSTGANGNVESMHPVTAITIPAGGSVTLGPGGYHLMLVGLKADLTSNDAFLVRMHFENAGWIVAIVHVRAI